MEGSGLEAVGDLAVHIILTKLGPTDTASVGCVSRRFRVSASEDSLWSQFCLRELCLSSPLDSLSNPCPSFKEAYKSWRHAFRIYPWPLVLRVKSCWDRLKAWLDANYPEAVPTLQKGASEFQIQEFEKVLKVKLPLPTRILYRFFDGQEFPPSGAYESSQPLSLCGVIGGYSFYEHLVNVYMLPLVQVTLHTKHINHYLGTSNIRTRNIVVASSTYSDKFFFLNCTSGQLFVGTKNTPFDAEMMPCVPSSLVVSGRGDQQQDGLLLWLEEHCRRLESGIINVREIHNTRTICQFPEDPFCSTAVTHGVRVRASAVFVPELSDLEDHTEKYWFSYSIRMSLLQEGCTAYGMCLNSCQLSARHWIIRAHDRVVSDITGEAVIGQYPLLRSGEPDFVYESCTPLPTPSGSVEGSFTFVPGRLMDPKAGPFEALVAQFPLQVPDYIF